MKVALSAALSAVLCFGASPTYANGAAPTEAATQTDVWPGGNKKARKITKRARKRTLGITKFAAFKVMKRRKAKRKKFQRAQKSGFNRADKSGAPRKKSGCNG